MPGELDATPGTTPDAAPSPSTGQGVITLGAITSALGGTLSGGSGASGCAETVVVRGLASLREATSSDLGFLVRPQQAALAATSRAGAFIVAPDLQSMLPPDALCILTENPYLYYARLSIWLSERTARAVPAGVSPSAFVAGDAVLGADAVVAPLAHVGAGSVLGDRVHVGAGAYVGAGVVIGADSILHPGARVLDDCTVGERCILHAGVVVGADGFGFAPRSDRSWQKIAQLGAVRIGDDVEIGANTCIDRGALDDTVIGDGCKIDNLVQIAHGVRIGRHTAIAACAGIAGSATIGSHVQIGGAAGIAGHITVCDGTVVSTMTLISRSITRPGFYSGIYPSMDNAQWERSAVVVRQLPEMRRRLMALERQSDRIDRNAPRDPGPDHNNREKI